jgi:hypothetical protein
MAGPVVVTEALVFGLGFKASFHFESTIALTPENSPAITVTSSYEDGMLALTVCPLPPAMLVFWNSAVPDVGQKK